MGKYHAANFLGHDDLPHCGRAPIDCRPGRVKRSPTGTLARMVRQNHDIELDAGDNEAYAGEMI
jgi:hypothetical protein